MHLRIGAGSANGAQSRIWGIVIRGSDVYLFARSSVGVGKVSLHCAREGKPPICQWSLVPEFFNSLPPDSGLPAGRHLVRWPRLGPDSVGQSFAARLTFPYASLANRPEAPSKPVVWLGSPGPTEAIDVLFVFCTEADAPFSRAVMEFAWGMPLLDRQLPNGEWFRLFTQRREFTEQDREVVRASIERIQTVPATWKLGEGDTASSDAGIVLHGTASDGIYTFQDVAIPPGLTPL